MAKLTPEEIVDQLAAENEKAITFDGYEDCLIGICYQFGRPPVACYDYNQCIQKLMDRDGMDHEQAVEFFEFNSLGSGVGENGPVFVNLFT
jgi:hypothetical protein